jgi:DNA modification methylase
MSRLQILTGDCRDILPTLEPQSVQCCVTSPPYWGLRDYGTAQWEGGDGECDHLMPPTGIRNNGRSRAVSGGTFHDSPIANQIRKQFIRDCGKCGALRIDAQLGLESTPEEYIANMVAVFRAVGRVLRDDGTCWINLGDSYAQAGGTLRGDDETKEAAQARQQRNGNSTGQHGGWEGRAFRAANTAKGGLKPKDLCMMPARLALALQADGWYLRSEIVWHKPNPMPESVIDRPTKAHEMIYLLAKQERYFYDAEAIREKSDEASGWARQRFNGDNTWKYNGSDERVASTGQRIDSSTFGDQGFRNKRSVWTIATQPYSEAHFATFPEEIPKLCILAGSRPGDTVLDPFAGSGTVGKVALELGRRAILIELNPAYIELAEDRTFVTPGFL